MLFDSHCHLNFSLFDNDREAVIKRIRDLNMKVINVGTDLDDSEEVLNLAKQYPDVIWASVGIHPHAAEVDFSVQDWNEFEKLAEDEKVVAIGECGLDYYHEAYNTQHITNIKERQKELFIKHINLAKKLNKPLIIHCRPSVGTQDAYEDALDILNDIGYKNGVMHFFSGSKETAKKFIDFGFYISFAGPITFHPMSGANTYKELVQFVPIERILIETDAPFAAPVPHRGKRNEPAFVEFVARQIAEWKNVDFETIVQKTSENTRKLFKII